MLPLRLALSRFWFQRLCTSCGKGPYIEGVDLVALLPWSNISLVNVKALLKST